MITKQENAIRGRKPSELMNIFYKWKRFHALWNSKWGSNSELNLFKANIVVIKNSAKYCTMPLVLLLLLLLNGVSGVAYEQLANDFSITFVSKKQQWDCGFEPHLGLVYSICELLL